MTRPTIPDAVALAVSRPLAMPHKVTRRAGDPPDEHRVVALSGGGPLGVVRKVYLASGAAWRSEPIVGDKGAHKTRADAGVAVARAMAAADRVAAAAGVELAEAGYCGTVFHDDDGIPAPCVLADMHGWPAGRPHHGHESARQRDAARLAVRQLAADARRLLSGSR